MKKNNQLSREELKKVSGGAPPFKYYMLQCYNSMEQPMGPPFEVDDCSGIPFDFATQCSSNGYPAAFYFDCYGGW